jgi:hypothetical protein
MHEKERNTFLPCPTKLAAIEAITSYVNCRQGLEMRPDKSTETEEIVQLGSETGGGTSELPGLLGSTFINFSTSTSQQHL